MELQIVKRYESAFCGETRSEYHNRLIARVRELNNRCNEYTEVVIVASFNGPEWFVTKFDTLESSVSKEQAAELKDHNQYIKSAKYKKYCAEKEKKELNQKCKIHMEKFEDLTLTSRSMYDMEQLLSWLKEYHQFSNNANCDTSNDTYIIERLENQGLYVENQWVLPDEAIDDFKWTPSSHCEWIVGQAINMMRMVALHPAIEGMVEKWKKEYKLSA